MSNKSITSILKNLPLKSNARIMDIGSGINPKSFDVIELISQGEIIALEIDKEKIISLINSSKKYKKIGHKTKIHGLCFDVDHGNTLPVKDNSCDVIILTHTLRHIIYRESLLKECKRALVPGGLILVVELIDLAHGAQTHPDHRISIDDMFEYLDKAGFIIAENFDTTHNEYGIIGVCPVV